MIDKLWKNGNSYQEIVTNQILQRLCYLISTLAGGQSKTICIYNVGQTLLVKKFEVTQNRSFDAMDDVISRKKISEFGNLALIEDREDPRGKTAIKLPGTRKGDLSSRVHRPEVSVTGLEFSPTGSNFLAVISAVFSCSFLDNSFLFGFL